VAIGITDIEFSGRFLRIAAPAGDGYRFIDDPEMYIEAVRNLNQRVDIFTFMQQLPETSPKYTYAMEWDNFAAVQLTTFDDWWQKQIGFKARNKAKQAEKKGVVIKEVSFDKVLVKGISDIYNECPVRQGRPFTHYHKSIERVYKEVSTFPDCSIFIGAYLDEQLVGFTKLVYNAARTQAGLMNIVAMIRHRDKAVTNALIVQAVRSCTKRHIPYLVYSRFAYGNKEKSSISDFKERNAFMRVDVPRYYIPMTTWGRYAMRFNMHHKLVDRLPQFAISRLRLIRNYWYNRKLKSLREDF
jgi:hypothetical protein